LEVAVNIVLFNSHKYLVGVFVLVPLDMDEKRFQWCTLLCQITDCHIKAPVIHCHIAWMEVQWGEQVLDIGDDSIVIAVALKLGGLESLWFIALDVMVQESKACKESKGFCST